MDSREGSMVTVGSASGMSALDILCSVATSPVKAIDTPRASDRMGKDILKSMRAVPEMRIGAGFTSQEVLHVAPVFMHTPMHQSDNVSNQGASMHKSVDEKFETGCQAPQAKCVRRQSYTRFSPEEERYLGEGVKRFGAGSWKKILSFYAFNAKRTPVDLKDKYRNMMRVRIKGRQSRPRKLPTGNNGHESDVSGNCSDHESFKLRRQSQMHNVSSLAPSMITKRIK